MSVPCLLTFVLFGLQNETERHIKQLGALASQISSAGTSIKQTEFELDQLKVAKKVADENLRKVGFFSRFAVDFIQPWCS